MIPSRNYLVQKKVRHTRSKKGKEYWYMLQDTKWVSVSAAQAKAAISNQSTYALGIKKGGKVRKALRQWMAQNIHTAADRIYINSIIATGKAEKKTWTVQQIQAMFTENKIAIAIANTGLDPNELAQAWGVSVADLFDEKNWTSNQGKSIFRDPNTGKQYEVTWDYDEGSSWIEI